MSIVTITHDVFAQGREIAQEVAARLNYECIGPEAIQEDCGPMDLPQTRGLETHRNASGFFSPLGTRKERYLARFRAAFFEALSRGNRVYHGSAGHIFLAEVPGVLKVRITADFEERIRRKRLREGLGYAAAKRQITRDDREQAKWIRRFWIKDSPESGLFDLRLSLHSIRPDAAAAIIATAVRTSTNEDGESVRRRLEDLALEARVEARLLEVFSGVEVIARDGYLYVNVEGSILQEELIIEKARGIIAKIWDVDRARVGVAASLCVPF